MGVEGTGRMLKVKSKSPVRLLEGKGVVQGPLLTPNHRNPVLFA